MAQTVPATAVLGPGATGLTIGYRVLNLDGTEYSAFSTTDVAETSTAGTYRKANGVVMPDAGGYIVWGTALVDYAEATVDGSAAYHVLTTPANKLDVSAGGEAGIDWANVGSPTTTVGLSGTTIKTATDVATAVDAVPTTAEMIAAMDADPPAVNVTTWKGATAPDMTGDAYARLGTPAGASVSADVAAVKVDTAAVLEDTGTTLDTLIKDVPTVAEFEARTLVAADYTVVGDLPSVPSAADVADAVWDEALADHTDAGSAGAGLAAAGSAGDPWSTVLPGSYGASTAGQIVGELASDWADGGRLDVILDAKAEPGDPVTIARRP